MKQLISVLIFAALILVSLPNCRKNKKTTVNTGTCSDGLKNQDETAADCGGVCSPCQTCSDGIKNQGETGIDCGGPCNLCPITYPKNGFYGINLIGDTVTRLISGPFPPNVFNKPYSIAAKLPSGTSVKVRITCLYTNVASINKPWFYEVSSLGTWKVNSLVDGITEIYNDSEGNPDLRLIFCGDGNGRLDVFENGETTPALTKFIFWRQ